MKLRIKESVETHLYRVWYNPYLLDDEEDYIEVTATNEEEARRKVRSSGYVTDVELIENTIKESIDKIDIMSLPTSERLDILTKLFDKYPFGVSTEQAMKWFEENDFDTTNYSNEQFNDDWDDWLSFYDYDEEEPEEEIETKEDAYNWLQSKLAEYGNTYHFNNEDKYKLDQLINRFGNTYFWSR